MLDEGLNEYWNQRMLVQRKQRIAIGNRWTKLLGFDISMSGNEMERLGAQLGEPADPLGENSWHRYSSGSYGSVYSRTATTMRDLEVALGKDVVERAFKLYYARWKFRHPGIADLREALVEASGRRDVVERTFAQHIYGVSKVDNRIVEINTSEVLPQPGLVEFKGKPVELTQELIDKAVENTRERWKKAHPKAKPEEGAFPYRTHVVVRRTGAVAPQTLLVKFADGSSKTVRWDDDRTWARFSFTTRSKAVSAELDPERRTFLDRDRLDDSRTVESNGAASRRWGSDAASLLQSLFALLVTL